MTRLACSAGLLALAGCAGPPPAPSFDWTELGAGLRIDPGRRVVEFDGTVATDVHDPITPTVWLELFVTGPDTREHESLVVTRVPPSLIHAALLAVGAEPGSPGRVRMEDDGGVTRRPATGDPVRVEFVLAHGTTVGGVHDPASWVVHETTGEPLADSEPWGDGGFVFAGSRVVVRGGQTGGGGGREVYDADMTGVVVPLTTFGSGVIAPRLTLSHASDLDEPVWVARRERVPAFGVPVTVRVTLLD
ncbi:MAG: YdjY domain-containing protein [Phycisphaerales bacterium JB040]